MSDFTDPWENWSSFFNFLPRRIFTPLDVKELRDVVAKANKLDARHVKVSGSRWSYSDIAVTHDYAIDVSRLKRILAFSQGSIAWGHRGPKRSPVLPDALRAAVMENRLRRFAHFEAGVTIKELYTALDDPSSDTPDATRDPWALPTMGGSSGQTVVGAIATSTHGGDFKLPPLQEVVRAIHLVDANGAERWIEGAGVRSITDPMKLAVALPGVMAHYDDGLFLSTLVGMGCLGAIYSMIVEVVPQYGLTQRTATAKWPAVRDWLAGDKFMTTSLGVVPPPGHFVEILINPYRESDDYSVVDLPDAPRSCVLALREFAPGSPADISPPPDGPGPLELATQIITLESGSQGAARAVVDFILQTVTLRETLTTAAKSFRVMDPGGSKASPPAGVPVQGLEFAISTRDDQHISFLKECLRGFDELCHEDPDNKFAGGLAVRFTLPTEAYLGIQQRAANPFTGPPPVEHVCHVEIISAMEVNVLGGKDPGEFEGKTEKFIRRFEEIAARYKDLHVHWGMLSLTSLHDPNRYIGYSSWKQARKQLVGASRVFDNDFTVRYGISPGASNWSVLSGGPPAESPRSRPVEANPELLPGSPTSCPDDATPADRYPPTAYRDAADELEVVVLGSDGQACWDQRGTDQQGTVIWFGWQVLPAPDAGITDEPARRIHFVGRMAQGTNEDGHEEIFARCGDNNRIFHAWRTGPYGTEWEVQDHGLNVTPPPSQWREMDHDTFDSSPDVVLDGDGHLHLIARTTANEIFRRCQNWSGWSGWELLGQMPPTGVTFSGDPAIVAGGNRVLTVVCRDTSERIWFSRQTGPGSGASWTNWATLGTSRFKLMGDPVAVNSAGLIHVFAKGMDTQTGAWALLEIAEATSNQTWDPEWSAVPCPPPIDGRRPAAIRAGAELHVAFLDGGSNVQHVTNPMGVWKAVSIGGPFTSFPSVAENTNGRIEIFVKFANDLVQHRSQVSPGKW